MSQIQPSDLSRLPRWQAPLARYAPPGPRPPRHALRLLVLVLAFAGWVGATIWADGWLRAFLGQLTHDRARATTAASPEGAPGRTPMGSGSGRATARAPASRCGAAPRFFEGAR